jgi:hypothetical protein
MNLQKLREIPPWDWPRETDVRLLGILQDRQADETDRLVAAELAADITVINDALAAELLSIAQSDAEADELRSEAASSLGPALEESNVHGFDDDPVISADLFQEIRQMLHKLYMATGSPKVLRRRILEASVRAPESWHADVIEAAYSSDDIEWKLTAVFCMRFVRGFDTQIVEALQSDESHILYEAVYAAGEWRIDAAWPHLHRLLTSEDTAKPILLAAIESADPGQPGAEEILGILGDSDDEEIAGVALDTLAGPESLWDEDDT